MTKSYNVRIKRNGNYIEIEDWTKIRKRREKREKRNKTRKEKNNKTKACKVWILKDDKELRKIEEWSMV